MNKGNLIVSSTFLQRGVSSSSKSCFLVTKSFFIDTHCKFCFFYINNTA
jgi:hypothetical protein